MTEVYAGAVEDFEPDVRVLIRHRKSEIGVFREGGEFHAFVNRCPHQGGPACEGIVIGKVETLLSEQKEDLGMRFSKKELHLVCPWHAWEFDLATGVCAADPRFRLRKHEVRVEAGRVYVVV